MKKNWIITLFSLFMIICTTTLQCKTIAISPTIPGQPLIFHVQKPTLSPIEKKILARLSSHQVNQLTKLSVLSQEMSQELVGFIGDIFLPLSGEQQQNITSLYLFDINDDIQKIKKVFLSSSGNESISSLLEQTLTHLVEITNQMLTNTAINSNSSLFQANYNQMQDEVINPFNAALTSIIKDSEKETYFKAESRSALEGLVSCIALCISNTNNVVNGDNPGSKSLVLVRQQIEKKLVDLVESTFFLEVLTSK